MNPFSKQTAQELYRVQAGRDELEMVFHGETYSFPAEITGLSMEGVGFFLPKEGVTPVQVGEAIRLTFDDVRSGLKVQAVGIVTEWLQEEKTHRVDVQFTSWDTLAEQLGESDTWRHFNRRQYYRVHPRMSHCRRSTVVLQWRGHNAPHVLHDVSAGGLSIRLATNDSLQVPHDRPIKATLNLPHSNESLEFTLRWIHEIDAASHRRIGFALDPVRTPYVAQVEDQLVAAVMEWQRTAIQVASNVQNPVPRMDA